MTRASTRSILAACVAYGLLGGAGAACGSGTNGTGPAGDGAGKDAGHKDSSVSTGGDDSEDSGGFPASDDSSFGDDAAATDAGDDAGDNAGAEAGAEAGDDGSAGDGGDDAGDAAAPGDDSGAEGGAGGATEAGTTDAGGDAGRDAGGRTPDASATEAGATGDGSTCDYGGTWASQIAVNVTWAAGGSFQIVIAPGSGTIKQWLLSTRTVSGTTATDTARLCGIELPDFTGTQAVGSETWGVRFPDALFDGTSLASFTIPGTIADTTPTAAYQTSSVAVLLGLTLSNAATAAWPATISTAVDEDDDKKPGVTAGVAQGAAFSDVPLDFTVVVDPSGVARSNRLYLAIRQVTSIAAHFSSCNQASGTVTVPQLGSSDKYAIDSHVVGCGLTGSSTDCTSAQASFVDSNQPVFVPSTTTFTSTRVPASTTCATVRGMF
jgi:hypothetical protein